MALPVVKATLQAGIICLVSCVVAHLIAPDEPPHYWSLLAYSLVSTPPNFLWQTSLERWFPGYEPAKVKVDDGGKGVEVQKKLNIRNTAIKVILDQTVIAVPNTVAYIAFTRICRGIPLQIVWEAVRQQTIPVMMAGYKFWPVINISQHVFIPVDKKLLVGNLFGIAWGAFLALKAAR